AVPTGDTVVIGDIPRIAERINYLDHLEADLPNIQIDRPRAGYTDGIEIKGRVRISFHTMSYPGANLIWHCPYIILFNSSDGKVNGENYEEYQMLKINGEDDTDERPYDNKFSMKKGSSFPGWESWKERNKQGLECVVEAERKGNTVTVRSENLGISIENILTVTDDMPGKVYVALSGDQVALTDIRIG
ncbi:MAG: diguanylate cyclase, partial [Lachnospiraceae bacterium]|nr:diguanylate cyclase [Lachnospiraceae bacterium]